MRCDQTKHSFSYTHVVSFSESEDYTILWNALREKVSLVNYDKACPGQGTFGHIINGYDAGYYGYDHTQLV